MLPFCVPDKEFNARTIHEPLDTFLHLVELLDFAISQQFAAIIHLSTSSMCSVVISLLKNRQMQADASDRQEKRNVIQHGKEALTIRS
jgi:hypothetical protein